LVIRLIKSYFSLILILFLLGACATGGRKDRSELRILIEKGQYNEALKLIDRSKFFKENKSRLLGLMEKGMIYHLKGHYSLSNKWLSEAKNLSQKLYTKSIKAKLKAAVANDNYDLYYGEVYERSTVHLYLALNHYLLYQRGTILAFKDQPEKKMTINEKRSSLIAARSEVLAWDSFLSSVKDGRMGKSVFKNDLMAKILGASIHEAIDTSNDRQIALQLYKDAKQLLFKNYNAYPTFNGLDKKFRKNFSKFPKMKKSKIAKNYTQNTPFFLGLDQFLNEKILILTKIIRPRQWKSTVRQIRPSKELLKRIKKIKKMPKLKVIVQSGFVPHKIPVKHYFGLEQALVGVKGKTAKTIARFGHAALTVFAANKLGLVSGSVGQAYAGMQVASVATAMAAISFELPGIKEKPLDRIYTLKVYNEQGSLVHSKEIPVINPMGDIASEAVREHSSWLYTRLGARLATKHITAIATAFLTYNLLKSKGEFIAKTAAVAEYVLATKLIESSEKADTRFWGSLPNDFRMVDVNLPYGNYQLKMVSSLVQKSDNHKIREFSLGKVTISKGGPVQMVTFRAP